MLTTRDFLDWLGEHPEFIAILVVVAGWLVARLIRHAIGQLVPWLNRRAARLGPGRGALVSPGFQKVLQSVAFWGILLTALVAALYLLGGGGMSGWLDRLLTVVPQLLVALGIVAAGHLLGLLARSLLARYYSSPDRQALPVLAYAAIVGTAAITAVEHLGLEVSFLTRILLIVVGAFLAGLALAFAFGARALVANLAAQGEVQRYKPGDRLRIDGVEGSVVEVYRTGVLLSTPEGLVAVPASKFATGMVLELKQGVEEDG